MIKKISIHTDGGARGNPGPSAVGVVISDQDGRIIKKIGQVIGIKTNNQAEYEALILALTEAKALAAEQVECFLDSELVVKQVQGLYKVREEGLKPLASKVLSLTASFSQISFKHVPREKNQLADKLVNEALDKSGF
ncbi:MAG TPA: ribonuclease HI family protein [Methylomirabilota bacterium]|nr:ribonuclease HI family protein [Methylomirabilota bacterium]